MESSTILTPPSMGLSGSWFLTESNIPKGPEYEKISTLYRCTGIYKDVYFLRKCDKWADHVANHFVFPLW